MSLIIELTVIVNIFFGNQKFLSMYKKIIKKIFTL